MLKNVEPWLETSTDALAVETPAIAIDNANTAPAKRLEILIFFPLRLFCVTYFALITRFESYAEHLERL